MTKKANCLPFIPDVDSVVVLQYSQNGKMRELSYRPKKVYLALNWLKINNHLYKDIILIFPEWDNYEVDAILYLDDNIHNINDTSDNQSTASNSNNSELLPISDDIVVDNSDKEILLYNDTKLVNHLKSLKKRLGILNPSDNANINEQSNTHFDNKY